MKTPKVLRRGNIREHSRVANGIDLGDPVARAERVKSSVQPVEHARNLRSAAARVSSIDTVSGTGTHTPGRATARMNSKAC